MKQKIKTLAKNMLTDLGKEMLGIIISAISMSIGKAVMKLFGNGIVHFREMRYKRKVQPEIEEMLKAANSVTNGSETEIYENAQGESEIGNANAESENETGNNE